VLAGIQPVSWAPRVIDLAKVSLLTPFDVVAIASLRARLQAEGSPPEFILPRTPPVREYMSAVGLLDDKTEVAPGLMIGLRWLPNADAWDDLLPEIIPDLFDGLPDGDLARRSLEVLSELIDNAGTHGLSTAGTFVCAQCYRGGAGLPAGLWLGVADAGPGIPAHLRLNPRYAGLEQDEQLIRLARRPWVTGTRDRRGWGLVSVFENAAGSRGGEVLIRSGGGEGFFRPRPDSPPFARYHARRPRLPGTWVHARLCP
jgi:hypothetical protein